MSLNIRHVGIYVDDIDKMIDFYINVFQLKIIYHIIEEGPQTDRMFASEGMKIEVCKMVSSDGGIIELIKKCDKRFERNDQNRNITNTGQMHIAFTVKDAEQKYSELVEYKCRCSSVPVDSSDGKVRVFFATDPEGNFLELVEEK